LAANKILFYYFSEPAAAARVFEGFDSDAMSDYLKRLLRIIKTNTGTRAIGSILNLGSDDTAYLRKY